MKQKGFREIIVLASILIIGIIFLLVINKNIFKQKANTLINSLSTQPNKGMYKAKSFCGEFHYIRKIANNYQEALNIFRDEKINKYTKYCPGNPCHDIEITSKKVQGLTDINGNSTPHVLYLITIQDKSTKLPVQGVLDALDDEGVLYDIPWCQD